MNSDFASRCGNRWRVVAAWSACLLGLASSRAAHAKPGDTAEHAPARTLIALVFDPNRREAEATIRAIESHLSGMGVVVVQERVTRDGDLLAWLDAAQDRARALEALGVFSIDAEAASEVRVFFSEPDGEATLIRRIRGKPTGARVGLEEAAIVVRSIVEALRDGGHVGMVEPAKTVEAPRPPTTPAPPPRESSAAPTLELTRDPTMKISTREAVTDEPIAEDETYAPQNRGSRRISLGLSAVGTSWAAGEGWQFGPALGLQYRLSNALQAELEYSWFSDLHVKRDDATFALTRHPIAASLIHTPFIGLSPVFQAGMFVDLVSRRTESAEGSLRGTGQDDRWTWGFGGRVGVTATPLRFLHARLVGGADVPTSGLDYVVEGDSRQTLLSMRSVRPHLEASIRADLW